MLFSDVKVAGYINEHFESTWRSLRPVPQVSIDFGNGKVVKRTLHGNIATFICTADGAVINVLAGVYSPEAFLQQLESTGKIVAQLPAAPDERRSWLTAYHRDEAQRREPNLESSRWTEEKLLGADTVMNAGERRARIHSKLSDNSNARPDDIMKWLYREVLHADLDDPYLGLQQTLFATYPFKD